MKILRLLLSLAVTLLLPVSALEYLLQYSGAIDVRSLVTHQPLLVLTFFLSGALTILLALPNRKTPEPLVQQQDDSALTLLGLLQEQGRFLDFLLEDIAPYSDTQVSSAARVVHNGCRKVVLDAFAPVAVASVKEGESLSGVEGKEFRLIGKVGKGPYSGRLRHRGWKISKNELPSRRESSEVLTPAELEVMNGG